MVGFLRWFRIALTLTSFLFQISLSFNLAPVIATHSQSKYIYNSNRDIQPILRQEMTAKSIEESKEATGNVDARANSTPIKEPHEAEGIIFDIDGTLADSWKLGFDATQVVLQNNNIPEITEDLYHECTRYSTPDRLARHAGLLPSDEDNDNDDTEFWKVGQKLADEFDELYVGLVSLETAGFYEGIQDLIRSIPSKEKGVKVAALTNACVAYAHAVLRTNCPGESPTASSNSSGGQEDIYTKFLSIHGADTVPKPKPQPDGLYQCCDEIGVAPERCVYVGDSPSDAVAAKASGMLAVGVLWGSHPLASLEKAPFDYLCKDVKELKQLLLRDS